MTPAAAQAIRLAPPRATAEPAEHAVDHDGVLVRMAQGGDTAAFGRIVRRHERRVLAVARRAADVRDPEDVAQEAFLRAWRAIDRVDPERPLAPWLLTIAVRTARTHGARERRRWHLRRRHAREATPRAIESDPASRTTTSGAVTSLWRTVDRVLAPDARTAVWLRYGEELPTRTIAVVLGSSDDAVRALLARARRTLRRHLDQHASGARGDDPAGDRDHE